MPKLNIDDLIVLDESGCHFNMTLPYARATGGKRVAMPIPFKRGSKISVIGAISSDSVEAAIYGKWNTDGEIFTAFVKQCLAPKLSAGKIVIMDNVKFHSTKKAVEAINKTGATILFLPPYSPELSPIENMWSKIKQLLKILEPKSWKTFKKAIAKAFAEIKKSDLFGWFKHCGYCA